MEPIDNNSKCPHNFCFKMEKSIIIPNVRKVFSSKRNRSIIIPHVRTIFVIFFPFLPTVPRFEIFLVQPFRLILRRQPIIGRGLIDPSPSDSRNSNRRIVTNRQIRRIRIFWVLHFFVFDFLVFWFFVRLF